MLIWESFSLIIFQQLCHVFSISCVKSICKWITKTKSIKKACNSIWFIQTVCSDNYFFVCRRNKVLYRKQKTNIALNEITFPDNILALMSCRFFRLLIKSKTSDSWINHYCKKVWSSLWFSLIHLLFHFLRILLQPSQSYVFRHYISHNHILCHAENRRFIKKTWLIGINWGCQMIKICN